MKFEDAHKEAASLLADAMLFSAKREVGDTVKKIYFGQMKTLVIIAKLGRNSGRPRKDGCNFWYAVKIIE